MTHRLLRPFADRILPLDPFLDPRIGDPQHPHVVSTSEEVPQRADDLSGCGEVDEVVAGVEG
jgi:hypothetical protein